MKLKKIDLRNKFTIDELDELTGGLGTKIINYLPQNMSSQEHYEKMDEFEEELKKYDLSPEDIFLNKGPVTGKLLSTQFKEARERLETYSIVESRFY